MVEEHISVFLFLFSFFCSLSLWVGELLKNWLQHCMMQQGTLWPSKTNMLLSVLTTCMWMERKYTQKCACIRMHVRPTIFSYKQHLGETSLRARHHRGKSPTPQRAKYISVPCQLQTMAAAQKILFTQTLRCSDDNMEMIQKECCLKITKAFSVSDVI